MACPTMHHNEQGMAGCCHKTLWMGFCRIAYFTKYRRLVCQNLKIWHAVVSSLTRYGRPLSYVKQKYGTSLYHIIIHVWQTVVM